MEKMVNKRLSWFLERYNILLAPSVVLGHTVVQLTHFNP